MPPPPSGPQQLSTPDPRRSIADEAVTQCAFCRGLRRGPYRIIQRAPSCQAGEIPRAVILQGGRENAVAKDCPTVENMSSTDRELPVIPVVSL
jgi:hypothetical protein